jgi:hypothetical protein
MKSSSTILLSVLLLINSSGVFAADGAQHFPAIFVGYTNAQDETHFTYGVEYEYKFNQTLGLGAVYEKVDDAHHGDGVTVTLAQLFYHPINNVRMGVGIGKEKIGGARPHSEDLYRVSANYDFHVGDFGIEPTIAIDFKDDDQAYVFGLAFSRPF